MNRFRTSARSRTRRTQVFELIGRLQLVDFRKKLGVWLPARNSYVFVVRSILSRNSDTIDRITETETSQSVRLTIVPIEDAPNPALDNLKSKI